MTTRTPIRAALVGTAVALAFTNAGATDIDLTGGFDVCATTNGATVCSANDSSGSTGSGTFPEFVGTNGGRPDTFFMYNTTSSPLEAGNEVGNGSNQNRDVTLGDFAVTSFGGVDVFTFVLDINQNNDSLLTLNHASIFIGDGSLTGYDAGADTLGGVAATWAMSVDDLINLDADLASSGSGRGDMFLYVPISLFDDFDTDDHLQLFSSFGDPNNNNSGFEEWSYLSCTRTDAPCFTPPPPPPVPEPGTLGLLGLGLIGLGMSRRRSKV